MFLQFSELPAASGVLKESRHKRPTSPPSRDLATIITLLILAGLIMDHQRVFQVRDIMQMTYSLIELSTFQHPGEVFTSGRQFASGPSSRPNMTSSVMLKAQYGLLVLLSVHLRTISKGVFHLNEHGNNILWVPMPTCQRKSAETAKSGICC